MEILLALMTGVLYAAGIYMILRRSLVKLILGLILLGNGVNLLIFLLQISLFCLIGIMFQLMLLSALRFLVRVVYNFYKQ